MKLELDIHEFQAMIKSAQDDRNMFFEMMRCDVQSMVGDYFNRLMNYELNNFLGREPYERKEGESNHRNGSYSRKFTLKGLGEVEVNIPRDRKGEYQTEVLPKAKRYESAIADDLSMLFLSGTSTRSLSMISKRLLGRKISHTEISNANKELKEAVEQWRLRDLSQEKIKYIYLDGVNFKMRVEGSIQLVNVLVAIGVSLEGHRLVLGMQSGDKESAGSWREFFKDLKQRGLEASHVQLGIMDGLSGLEKVFSEEFKQAKTQRCQVHVARNVLCKVSKKNKQQVADEVRSIFYASSKKKALNFFQQFKEKREKDFPSAVKCLENSLDSCLNYLSFPEEDWVSLRTTNLIERINKEFRRRTKTMEIIAGEDSCYRLLAFISLKMEVHWRVQPVGKVKKSLPFFQQFEK